MGPQSATRPTSTSWWQQVLTLLRLQGRRTVRDRAGLGFAVGGAVAIAVLASLALGGQRPVRTAVAIVVPPDTVNVVRERLSGLDVGNVGVEVSSDQAEAERGLVTGDFASVVVLPVPLSDASPPMVIANRNERVSEAISIDIARIASQPSTTPDFVANPLRPPMTVDRPLNGAERWGVMLAVFFLFLTVGLIGRATLFERENGTLARLRTANVSASAVLVSKALAMFCLGIVELSAVFVVLWLFLGASWGNLVAVAIVAIAITLAVSAIGLLIVTVVKSPDQCFMVEVVVAVVLGLVAGGIIPVSRLPPWFARLAAFTPNGTAVLQFRAIAAGAGVGDVVGPVLVILAFAAVFGGIALLRARAVIES